MTQKIEAVYTGGVLKPSGALPLREQQRVRLTVETIDEPDQDRVLSYSRKTSNIGVE